MLMTQKNYKTIRQLEVNQRAKILEIRANGELGRRIRDMGILPGVELMVVGRAPLNDPVAIKINNFTITLRNNEADHIIVDTNL